MAAHLRRRRGEVKEEASKLHGGGVLLVALVLGGGQGRGSGARDGAALGQGGAPVPGTERGRGVRQRGEEEPGEAPAKAVVAGASHVPGANGGRTRQGAQGLGAEDALLGSGGAWARAQGSEVAATGWMAGSRGIRRCLVWC